MVFLYIKLICILQDYTNIFKTCIFFSRLKEIICFGVGAGANVLCHLAVSILKLAFEIRNNGFVTCCLSEVLVMVK